MGNKQINGDSAGIAQKTHTAQNADNVPVSQRSWVRILFKPKFFQCSQLLKLRI